MRTAFPMLVGLGLLALAPMQAQAGGSDILKSQCSACHTLTKPASETIDSLWDRKAPDLWYAGDKFNRDWLVSWLQSPTRIRPAGYPYFKTVIEGKAHDEIDESKLKPHMHLVKADAEAVADALMALKPEGIVEKGLYKNGSANMRMGAMTFDKFRGCVACHKGADGKGGFSGAELTDAGKRLQPDYIASFIKDPQKIDPHIWMPTLAMNDHSIQLLTGYLIQLSKQEKK